MLEYRRLLVSRWEPVNTPCPSETKIRRRAIARCGFPGAYGLLAAAPALSFEPGTPLNTQLSLIG